MAQPTFARFLRLAHRFQDLLRDIAAEDDLLSRARLLSYLEHHHIPPQQKSAVITTLTDAGILDDAGDGLVALNRHVADLINHFERRGRETDAGYLRQLLVEIGRQSDQLQQLLVADEPDAARLADTLLALHHIVRDVRMSGDDHFQACMVRFNALKQSAPGATLDSRLGELETMRRRYVEPLRSLIDPDDAVVHAIRILRRHLRTLGRRARLLAQAHEVATLHRRLTYDLRYIEQELLRHFAKLIDTERALLKSLLDERTIKNAVATCLADLDAVWAAADGMTVAATGRRSYPLADADTIAAFFSEVLQHRYLPDPRPLTVPEPALLAADDWFVPNSAIERAVADAGRITSWPSYAAATYADRSDMELLRVIAHPLLTPHAHIRLAPRDTQLELSLAAVTVTLQDFGLVWEAT